MLGKCLRFAREVYRLNAGLMKRKIRDRRVVYRRNLDYNILPGMVHKEAQCCFVLSTGRCGTRLLTDLLGLSEQVRSVHEPPPALAYFSKLAYEASHGDREKFRLGVDMARYELIRDAFLRNQIYVETNNKLTFFAPLLVEVFEQSRFIHLVRHPGDFVRSGIRREWYYGKVQGDAGRIFPTDDSIANWDKMTQIEKIAWLWNETNQFIEDFKRNSDSDRIIFAKAEDLFSKTETALAIFEFLQIEPPPERHISAMIGNPVNVQTQGDFPKYSRWNSEQKRQLRTYARLSSKYGYSL